MKSISSLLKGLFVASVRLLNEPVVKKAVKSLAGKLTLVFGLVIFFATVDPMDWEALPFYQKLSYSIEFVREGCEKESKIYRRRKKTMKGVSVREEICDLLSMITPLDLLERQHIDFVLKWIGSDVEIFRTEKPATPPIHLVSYFVVFSPDQTKILLVDHNKAELWLPPGGHVEPGEHPKDTVVREAKEELGIEAEFVFTEPLFVTITKTVGKVTQHTDVSLWYALKCDPDDPLIYDKDEFDQIRWFRFNEIPFEKSDPHLKRFLQKINFQKSELSE